MKLKLLLLVLTSSFVLNSGGQTCSTCGGSVSGSQGMPAIGPALYISMGCDVYGASAGHLVFTNSPFVTYLCTPQALEFTGPTLPDVTIVTNSDGSLRQVNAPQVLADIPIPSSTNGYVIHFYFASQVGSMVSGVFALTGPPFNTWVITNTVPGTGNTLEILETNSTYGLVKQNTYTTSFGAEVWTNQWLGGLTEEVQTLTSSATNNDVFIDEIQSPSGPVVRQIAQTYQTYDWSGSTNTALAATVAGAGGSAQITTNTYWDPAIFSAGSTVLLSNETRPDGSWTYYAGYDTNGNPTAVYSSYGDVALSGSSYLSAQKTSYTYNPTGAGVSGSGDSGTYYPNVARLVIITNQGYEVARRYTVFPSVDVRLDIQCTVAGAAWNASGNLFTTNFFYTSGPNNFLPQSVIYPDGTMTAYYYGTNSVGAYSTNIVVTGAPGSGYTAVVDGVSNVTVLDVGGYKVLAASYDVLTGTVLMYDNYGNFDGWGRPQQVTHLDGTTEYTEYACCGLDYTTDRDGVTTQYLYDAAHRPAGYEKIYSSTAIIYTNTLDAAGRTVETVRIGTNGSEIMLSGTEYDLADEALAETNALEGVTFRTRTNDATTGGLIRTAVNPDGGTLTNFYYLDGSLKMTVGTSVHGMTNALGVESVSGVERLFTQSFKLNTSGVASSEWKKTDVDMLGRAILTTYASSSGTPSAVVSFNSLGQMGSQKDPDNVATLYAYNPKGELAYTAVDINQNGSIDFSGTDRITFVTNDVTTYSGANVRRSRTYVWGTNSVNSSNLVSMTETSAEGLTNWQTRYRDASTAVVTETITEYSSGGTRLVTVTAPDNSYTINLYSYGWLSSTTRYDSTGAQIGATYYTYDAHGRQATVTDARNGTTSYTYNNADLVASVTTPNPGGVGSAETTTTSYDVMMRATNVVQPDGGTVTMVYLPTGELGQTYGSRTYPVQYTYDYAGRMQTMTNWSAFSGGSGSGARVTTWNYDVYRGFLTSKTDAVGLGPTYTYTAAGRLASRTWARGTNTAYAYNSGGDLATVIYSDSTPSVTYTYDRQGRQSSVVCGSTTTSIAYDWANDVLGESYSGGILGGLTVTNQFDSDLRRTSMALQNTMGTMCQANYGYDDASRLASVSDGNGNSNTYSYLAKSPLVGQITFSQSGTTRMTTTKQYDYLNRLSSIASSPSNSFLYEYNAANQRTLNRCWDGSYWRYGYDALGQVVSGNKYWSDMTPVAGQQFGYAFDTIGNRTQTEAGGDPTGANLRVANYTNNSDNQITSRDVPGYVDIMGNTLATNSVSVNGQPAYQKVEYFRDQFGVTNTSSAQWQRMTVSAPGQGSVTGHSYVAKTPENFTYDADGNLSSDGRWNYTWDAENRLIGMQSLSGAPSGSLLNLSFVYDYQGRRIQKTVSTNNGSYVVEYTDNYAYDGWNCVATLNSSLGLINSFMWGSDLSGSMQGAGGVGGLIEVSYYGSTTTNCFVGYDGNGNVSALVNAADGSVPAQYEYGPFGEVIRATGLAAKLNPFRFSTKYDDDESDLLYYGYRYYNPSTGRWLSRDPIGEKGGLNIYAFTGNNLITQIDSDGRGIVDCLKALADLAKWTAIVDGRVADIIAHGGNPDPGHQKALDQAVTNLNDALRRVAQYCTCYAISAALLQAAAAAIEAALPYLPVLAL